MKKWLLNLINIDKVWYTRHSSRWLLAPFAWIYQLVTKLRRHYLERFCQQRCSIPIIVVGNITVGGVGKTPLVIELAQRLQAKGVRIGIVSRGFGASVKQFPYDVGEEDTAQAVGDEPLLLVKKTGVPVVIAPNRMQAVNYLLDKYNVQMIISDDGLQHYRMGRAIEIAVVDGLRGLGNGLCLPAGPLRESSKRLKQVDFVVVNGDKENIPKIEPSLCYQMRLQPGNLIGLVDGKTADSATLSARFAAIAGIGHPGRFFATLDSLSVSFKAYPFPDHHPFKACDLQLPEKQIVMTEKDAVKCRPFATNNMYFLPVEAIVCEDFWTALWSHKQLQGYV